MIWQQQLGTKKLILALSAAALFASTAVTVKLVGFEGHTSPYIQWYDKDTIFQEVLDRAHGKVIHDKPVVLEFMRFDCSSCEDWYPIWNDIAEQQSAAFEVASIDCDRALKTCNDIGFHQTPSIGLFLPGARWTNANEVPRYTIPVELSDEKFMAWLNPLLAAYQESNSASTDTAQTHSSAAVPAAASATSSGIPQVGSIESLGAADPAEPYEYGAMQTTGVKVDHSKNEEVASSVLQDIDPVSAVLEIKSHEFPERIADYPDFVSKWEQPLVVEFKAPNCPKCKEVAPIWEQIAKDTTDVVIASYDCLFD